MSQLHIMHEPRSAEDWAAHLAEILLKDGCIVSDQHPFKLSKDLAEEWFINNYAGEIDHNLGHNQWDSDEGCGDDGEAGVNFHDHYLQLTVKSAENMILMLCCDCPDSEIVEQLSKWGPEQ